MGVVVTRCGLWKLLLENKWENIVLFSTQVSTRTSFLFYMFVWLNELDYHSML
jgi:hypothetical protein